MAQEFAGQLGERAGQLPHSQMPDNLQLAWATEEAVDHGGALGNSFVCLRVDMPDSWTLCLFTSVLGLQ